MPSPLSLHLASDAERVAAYRNVHDVWSMGLDMEAHISRRENSPKLQRAACYVGCVEGEVIASLCCFPIVLRVKGETLSAIAFGGVHTRSDHRGKGYAPQLIKWVEENRRAAGARVSLLYSDIDPNYYARLGYVLCPSWTGSCDVDQSAPDARKLTEGVRLTPCDPEAEADALNACYARYHADYAVSIVRDAAYQDAFRRAYPNDRYYWLKSKSDETLGYVRLGVHAQRAHLFDFALSRQDEQLTRQFLAAVIETARELGLQQVGGWMPNAAPFSELFKISPRKTEITMLKPLDPSVAIDADVVRDSQHFRESDHV